LSCQDVHRKPEFAYPIRCVGLGYGRPSALTGLVSPKPEFVYFSLNLTIIKIKDLRLDSLTQRIQSVAQRAQSIYFASFALKTACGDIF
jgi:hypothetical protein